MHDVHDVGLPGKALHPVIEGFLALCGGHIKRLPVEDMEFIAAVLILAEGHGRLAHAHAVTLDTGIEGKNNFHRVGVAK
jgi:hypothetical protein